MITPEVLGQCIEVGEERSPVLVIDDFSPDPQCLLEEAGNLADFIVTSTDFYPGVKKPVERHYRTSLKPHLDRVAEVFGASASLLENSSYSLVNVDPRELVPIQRVPHYDTAAQSQLAVVHFLCSESHGGTAFYRHRSTAYERIHASRESLYQRTLGREATTYGLPERNYPSDGGDLHQCLYVVAAKFNRALIYPASLLHSGYNLSMPQMGTKLSDQRLTITSQIVLTQDINASN